MTLSEECRHAGSLEALPLRFCTLNNFVSINSSGAHPHPGKLRICSRCQSRGWDTRKFSEARGLDISIAQGDPQAFERSVLARWMSLSGRTTPGFVKDWLIRQGLKKRVDVFKGKFSQFSIFLHYL